MFAIHVRKLARVPLRPAVGAMLLAVAMWIAAGATDAVAQGQVSLNPPFDPHTLNYTATVPHDVTEVTFDLRTQSPTATVTVNGGDPGAPVQLAVGENTIVIVVTPEDRSATRTYTIVVTRLEATGDGTAGGSPTGGGPTGGGPTGGGPTGGGPTGGTDEDPSDEDPADEPDRLFVDIDADSVHSDAISAIAAAGITSGCSATPVRFCPDRPVTRAEMATFLARALDLQPPEQSAGFVDIDADSVHSDAISAIAAAGITSGCSATPVRFCPDRPVTRAEMATFLARALDLQPPEQSAGFVDIDADSVHSDAISAIAAAGITSGCSATPVRFCPDRPVTRAEMATFLARALDL